MKKVYAAPDLLTTGHVHNLLQQAGISTQIHNYFLSGALGDLPINECWPEIWVADTDEIRALSILAEIEAQEKNPKPQWVCHRCGELNEGQFSECWKCGTTHPDNPSIS